MTTMLDREKVIKEYEDYVNSYISLTTSKDYEFEMHKAVLALLKEQEAKTVELIQKMDRSNKWGADLIGYCPSCKRPLKIRFNQRFCGECGQAVKWE